MVKLARSFIFSCLYVLFVSLASQAKDDQDKKVYIVYMGALPTQVDYIPMSHHMSILQEVTKESSIVNRLVRSYKKSFNGFAARLTESEREILASMEGVVSVFPNKILKLQTTTSWNFMGLKDGKKTDRNPSIESDTIIGVIDSGIWPESESFNHQNFGPPPKKWKGVCEGGKNFTCNNKLIGARYYTTDLVGTPESARDYIGHGSHTASTAAGNVVNNVSFYGLGNGTARGGVPAARIAVYKVCGVGGCSTEGILSAFDDAISDQVDLITISIGGDDASSLEEDPIAIGAFHAMAKGILTLNSAGNSGPEPSTVTSVAPWMLTVAASNTNRKFVTKVVLGNGKIVAGRSVNSFDLHGTKYPLVYGKSVSTSCSAVSAGFCSPGCLDRKLVKGKIVLCDSAKNFAEAQAMGAVASIVRNSKADVSFVFSFPVSALTNDDYETVLSYLNSTKHPKAAVLKSESRHNQIAPVIASFSSRGPNTIIPDILKPDITAPGTEILAAFSPEVSPSATESDTRHVKYSVLSGTSMSCPHVAGVAAYLKTFHPNWSPSMIQSSIMTTAWPMNASSSSSSFNEMSEFAYGAGHVNPLAAVHPGLVFEANKADHIAFLCGLNYSEKTIRLVSGDNSTCNKQQKKSLPYNLNYPSLTAKVSVAKTFKLTFHRTVTNVGKPNFTHKGKATATVTATTTATATGARPYKAKVETSQGSKLHVKVVPDVLSFKSVHEKKSFKVIVSGEALVTEQLMSAHLIWSDGAHYVRSPIVIYSTN